jgi:hypothetical protein
MASHLLVATMYKVSLPSRQPLAPPPLFACAFLLLLVLSLLKGFSLLSLFAGTLFGLKGFVVVAYYSLVWTVCFECLLQLCLWFSPWQNNLPNIMVDDQNSLSFDA